MRGEFAAISTAFNLLPQFAGNPSQAVVVNSGGTGLTVTVGALALAGDLTTTGAFNTVFTQQGSFTFTLPAEGGTLTVLSDVTASVLVETTRAEAAEGVLMTAVGTNATAIAAETTRAETAEAVNAATIAAETTRAEAVEAQALNNVGRNLFHNPEFLITQRGTGPFTTSGYTADRWVMGRGTLGSGSVSLVLLSDADRAAIGDEAALQAVVYTVTGGAGTNDFDEFNQRLESVKPTSGKTVTVSFWAKAASGSPRSGLTGSNFLEQAGHLPRQSLALLRLSRYLPYGPVIARRSRLQARLAKP